MNRGSREGESPYDGARAASMRPRFMNRGSGLDEKAIEAIRKCFNEAPIHESGK